LGIGVFLYIIALLYNKIVIVKRKFAAATKRCIRAWSQWERVGYAAACELAVTTSENRSESRQHRHAAMTVNAIALVAGFGDLSHFNRSFRRRYGATPSDVRAASPRGTD
jgi:AraC-like DNA-binding protein